MSHTEDQELLQRIAVHRDKTAFEELVTRYHKDCFNLAIHIAGNPTLAEDAVQEALLRLWLSARTFRAEGNLRGWILRIVCRECLRKLRTRKREIEDMSREEERLRTFPKEEPSSDTQELLAGLRASLGRLPEHHRQLIVLYFGGGLSQREIGAEMNIPPRTVSYRIDEAVRWLRENLKETGLAAALPLLNAEGLSQAICMGPVPCGLADRILEATRAKVLNSASQSLRAASRWPMASKSIAVLAVVFAGVVGWIMLLPSDPLQRAETKHRTLPPEMTTASGTSRSENPLERKRIVADFDSGMPENLAIDGAKVQWVPQEGKQGGGLLFGFDKAAAEVYGEGTPYRIYVPEKLTPPLRISFAMKGRNKSVFSSVKAFWQKPGERIERIAQVYDQPKRMWRYKGELPRNYDPDQWLPVTMYITADEVKGFYNNVIHSFYPMKMPKRAPDNELGFIISVGSGSLVVDDLLIEEIQAIEIPDISAMIELEPEHPND